MEALKNPNLYFDLLISAAVLLYAYKKRAIVWESSQKMGLAVSGIGLSILTIIYLKPTIHKGVFEWHPAADFLLYQNNEYCMQQFRPLGYIALIYGVVVLYISRHRLKHDNNCSTK